MKLKDVGYSKNVIDARPRLGVSGPENLRFRKSEVYEDEGNDIPFKDYVNTSKEYDNLGRRKKSEEARKWERDIALRRRKQRRSK